jgi:isochorismate synthase
MSTMMVRPAYGPGVASWLDARGKEQWHAALHAGQQRAAQMGQPVLVSIALAVAWHDPLAVFAGIPAATDAFFWERPDAQRALVGAGSAATIQAGGDSRFAATSAQWRTLLRPAVITTAPEVAADTAFGPLLCGGFAFDPQHPRTALWRGFPDALLTVPRWLFATQGDHAALTLNHCIGPDDEPSLLADDLPAAPGDLWASDLPLPAIHVHDMRPADEWRDLVAQTARMIRAGAFQKVVLARAVTAQGEQAFADVDVLDRLRASYPAAYCFAIRRGERTFMGATPERLARVEQGRVATMALAGSAPRGATPTEDAAIGAALLASAKNQIEHSIVADTIRAALALHCSMVEIADQPHLLKLKNVQHLETLISGALLPNRSIIDVIGELHPTPAVGGSPRAAALEVIRAGEGMDRGWYAAPVGWLDATGNGEFAVALRSALVAGDHATLFAGCGIVGDSDPASEYAESRLKLQVMLRALGDES